MKTELLFGFHSVGEALNANRRRFEEIIIDTRRTGPRFDKLRAEAEKRRIRVTDTSHERLGKLAGSDHHQGIAARVSPFAYSSIEEILATAAGQARSGRTKKRAQDLLKRIK